MWFGTLNIRSLCRSGSLTSVARELVRCKLDLVGVRGVRWDKVRTVRAGYCILFMERKLKPTGKRIFVHHRTVSTVRELSFLVIGCLI